MRNFFFGAAALLLASCFCLGQQTTVNSMSPSPNQNQVLTGETGHSAPPSPGFAGGVPDATDRVAGTPGNANVMRLVNAPPVSGEPNTPGMAVFLPAAGQNTPVTAPRANAVSRTSRRTRNTKPRP